MLSRLTKFTKPSVLRTGLLSGLYKTHGLGALSITSRFISSAASSSAATTEAATSQEFSSTTYDHNLWNTTVINPATRVDPSGRDFTYFVLGSGRFLYASVARVAVLKAISMFSPAADVLATAQLEVDISKVLEGTSITVMWRGKPVFIRHRNAREISLAKQDDSSDLRDPQTDAVRVQNEKWLIVMGICTHFGCVPVVGLGDYAGWFCPCHGSHYDTSGRIRKGPAPLNLEVPEYSFISDSRVLLGA